MTETSILDERAVSEIEARKPFYFCDKCGYFGEAGPVHLKPGYKVDCSYNAVRPVSELTIDALCATVKHLRARERELEKLAYLGEHHYPDQTWKARALEHHEQSKQLQSQLEQLRAENKRLKM